MYLPGDINGLAKKLHLLAAEFFAGNTTVRNELVHVLGALLRLKQLPRKEYSDITLVFFSPVLLSYSAPSQLTIKPRIRHSSLIHHY